ncbi:MAG TPA: hypothetical protein VKS01_10940, partial [Bryobacteraceae bacterium]|nr:hypothetical protein [Bryobacteraceae bacterium]
MGTSRSPKRDIIIAILLFLGVYLFSGLSRIGTSFDSRWTVYIAMSMWNHHDTNLDEYSKTIQASKFYALECVAPAGHVRIGGPIACDGHWYDSYPIGGTALTAPLVVTAVEVMRALHPLLSRFHTTQPVIEGFLEGDFDPAHPLIEMEVASMLLAAAAVMILFISRMYLAPAPAIWLTLLFAVATSAYSIAGRALWQHTPSMLLLTVIVYLLLRAESRPSLAGWVGLPVALAYTCRP